MRLASRTFSAPLFHGLIYGGLSTGLLLFIAALSDQGISEKDRQLAALAFVTVAIVFSRYNLIWKWHVGRAGSIGTGVLFSWFLCATGLIFLGFLTRRSGEYERRVILLWLALTPLLFVLAHHLIRYLFFRFFPASMKSRTAVIVFVSEDAQRLAHILAALDVPKFRLLGFFEDRGPERVGHTSSDRPVLGRTDEVVDYVNKHSVNVVFVVLPLEGADRATDIVRRLGDTTASIYFMPTSPLFRSDQLQFANIGGVPVFSFSESPFFGADGVLKRLMDILFSAGVLILLSPLLLIIAALIWATDGRPVFFTQQRYGLDGKRIRVHKFRTMRVAPADTDVRQATRDDPRVTPIGRVLRRTSIDELPQFWDVLRGAMSVVGPRPHAIEHNETYRGLIERYMLRHKVRPGLTGLAQINGLRGEIQMLENMERRVEYDLRYIRTWSPGLDVYIILRTVALIFRDRAAY
ncbi:undecaprenyl-phosphate glucose phosphotransferase [Salinisphaera sp. S4-8]|uniref:undecaprenyl-phosphate glucose phosphotransferase n=1 Tax=Salinisphaera sp. S4-8 TaxID=633357 RepID=UPI0033416F5A